jgi:hypothetical protein
VAADTAAANVAVGTRWVTQTAMTAYVRSATNC